MGLLVCDKILSLFFTSNVEYKLRVVLMVQMLALDIIFGLLFLNNILDLMINPFFRIVFIITYSRSMRKSFWRLIRTLKNTYEAVALSGLNILVFGALGYVLYFDVPNYKDVDRFFYYNFDSYLNSAYTLYTVQTTANFPDVFLFIIDK